MRKPRAFFLINLPLATLIADATDEHDSWYLGFMVADKFDSVRNAVIRISTEKIENANMIHVPNICKYPNHRFGWYIHA